MTPHQEFELITGRLEDTRERNRPVPRSARSNRRDDARLAEISPRQRLSRGSCCSEAEGHGQPYRRQPDDPSAMIKAAFIAWPVISRPNRRHEGISEWLRCSTGLGCGHSEFFALASRAGVQLATPCLGQRLPRQSRCAWNLPDASCGSSRASSDRYHAISGNVAASGSRGGADLRRRPAPATQPPRSWIS